MQVIDADQRGLSLGGRSQEREQSVGHGKVLPGVRRLGAWLGLFQGTQPLGCIPEQRGAAGAGTAAQQRTQQLAGHPERQVLLKLRAGGMQDSKPASPGLVNGRLVQAALAHAWVS